jgi:hypothetical protein
MIAFLRFIVNVVRVKHTPFFWIIVAKRLVSMCGRIERCTSGHVMVGTSVDRAQRRNRCVVLGGHPVLFVVEINPIQRIAKVILGHEASMKFTKVAHVERIPAGGSSSSGASTMTSSRVPSNSKINSLGIRSGTRVCHFDLDHGRLAVLAKKLHLAGVDSHHSQKQVARDAQRHWYR